MYGLTLYFAQVMLGSSIGTAMFAIMTTWWRGRSLLSQAMAGGTLPDEHFKWDKKKAAEEHGNARH